MDKGNTNDMDYYEELMISILFLLECTMKFAMKLAMNLKLHFWKKNFKLKCFTGFCHYGYVRKGGFQVWLCISTKMGVLAAYHGYGVVMHNCTMIESDSP